MGEIFMELSQSKIKISTLAIFEEIKDKTENCGKDFDTNEKKEKPYRNSRSGKYNKWNEFSGWVWQHVTQRKISESEAKSEENSQ